MKISFIAARYKEPISLLDFQNCIKDFLHEDVELEFIIYDKHELKADSYQLTENIGRENYAWFDYVINTWDNPSDYYAFIHLGTLEVRKDKLDANISLLQEIQKMIIEKRDFCCSYPGTTKSVDRNFSSKQQWLGYTKFNIEDVKKQPYKVTQYKTIEKWWKNLTDQSFPKRKSFGGMCCGSSKNLHSWGKEFWEKIFLEIKDSGPNGEIGHFLERSMLRIVEGKHE